MKIEWLGHASFKIVSDEGIRIITDPYQSGAYSGTLSYSPINEEADIVTASHRHPDHFYLGDISGNPRVIDKAGETFTEKDVEIYGVAAYHDSSGGELRGDDIVFMINVDGIRICHLGDLGHLLSNKQLEALGRVDILLAPVGGGPTIGGDQVDEMAAVLRPGIIIPMHFHNSKCDFKIAPVDNYLAGKDNLSTGNGNSIEVMKASITGETRVILLESSR